MCDYNAKNLVFNVVAKVIADFPECVTGARVMHDELNACYRVAFENSATMPPRTADLKLEASLLDGNVPTEQLEHLIAEQVKQLRG